MDGGEMRIQIANLDQIPDGLVFFPLPFPPKRLTLCPSAMVHLASYLLDTDCGKTLSIDLF